VNLARIELFKEVFRVRFEFSDRVIPAQFGLDVPHLSLDVEERVLHEQDNEMLLVSVQVLLKHLLLLVVERHSVKDIEKDTTSSKQLDQFSQKDLDGC
jgi:hypothetical protein